MVMTDIDDDLLALPTDDWATRALDLVLAQETRPLANHSIRAYLFARLLAAHEGMRAEVDDRLLFAATVLHDIGLRTGPTGPARFEVDGADRAAEFLRTNGFDERAVDTVWEAITLHTSPGIAERRGPVAFLTRKGVGMDFAVDAEFVTDAQAERIHRAYPRLAMATAVVDAIVAQCQDTPGKGPLYSLPGELTRERATDPSTTRLEVAANASRWGN